jgi:hypothetical protein
MSMNATDGSVTVTSVNENDAEGRVISATVNPCGRALDVAFCD